MVFDSEERKAYMEKNGLVNEQKKMNLVKSDI